MSNTTTPNYWVEVTKRINGRVVCEDHADLNGYAFRHDDGKSVEITICGGTAIVVGQSAYYDGPEPELAPGDANWTNSPHHDFSSWNIFQKEDRAGYDQYWYHTLSD